MTPTAEARFVTATVCEPVVAGPVRLASAAAAVSRWDLVCTLARRHQVTAFVERAIREHGLAVPRIVAEGPLADLRESVARAMLLERDLAVTLSILGAAGVRVIVLKGPALARMLYNDRQLRPYGDIDLAVNPADEAAAVAALRRLDYVELTETTNDAGLNDPAGRVHQAVGFHRLFRPHQSEALIELHLDTLQLGLAPRCETGRRERAEPLPGLPDALVLGAEDQLVTLAVHAHKHGFGRLLWLKDLDLLIRERPDLDWRLTAEVAQQEGVAASVWYAMKLTRRMLGTPVPADLMRRLRPRLPVRALYQAVWPPSRIENLDGRMRRRAVQLVLTESWRGTLPNLVLMGRRRDRARAALEFMLLR